MTDLTVLPQASIVRHQPELMREEQAKADAIIEYARQVKDWVLFEDAIDAKIEQQMEFVVSWAARVRSQGEHKKSRHGDFLSVKQLEALTDIQDHQVSRWRRRLKNRHRYRQRMIEATLTAAELQAAANHRAEGTGENEWFTPAQYIEAARLVLGEIDLDPATHPVAQKAIKASQYFTRADSGLTREWHGRIWLNPPYGRGEIAPFVDKLVSEIEVGRVSASIMLTHSYTDTEWFHHAVSVMQALCFTNGRIKFIDDAGDTCSPTQGQVFFYYGPDEETFVEIFGTFGFVTAPWRPLL